VHEANQNAIKFYKNKGFQQLGIRKKYYKDGGAALLFSWVKGKH
jgi:ribosomal protein S18 acetylase RimI-like enzyme